MATSNIASLAEEYAVVKAQSDELTAKLNKLRKSILETGCSELVGEHYTVTVDLSERRTLDGSEVKKLLTSEQIERCTKVSEVTTLRVKASAKSEAA